MFSCRARERQVCGLEEKDRDTRDVKWNCRLQKIRSSAICILSRHQRFRQLLLSIIEAQTFGCCAHKPFKFSIHRAFPPARLTPEKKYSEKLKDDEL